MDEEYCLNCGDSLDLEELDCELAYCDDCLTSLKIENPAPLNKKVQQHFFTLDYVDTRETRRSLSVFALCSRVHQVAYQYPCVQNSLKTSVSLSDHIC